MAVQGREVEGIHYHWPSVLQVIHHRLYVWEDDVSLEASSQEGGVIRVRALIRGVVDWVGEVEEGCLLVRWRKLIMKRYLKP